MTLEEFVASKPAHVRLGQWFVNNYCKSVNLYWEEDINHLWNLDGDKAHSFILWLVMAWQWNIDSMPQFKEEYHGA